MLIDFSGLPVFRFFVDIFEKVRRSLTLLYENRKIVKECSNELRIQTYAYCLAAVVQADGTVSNEERRRVGNYLSARFRNNSMPIAQFHRLVSGRRIATPVISKEFVFGTTYSERFAFAEMLFSIALTNQGNNEKGIDDKVVKMLQKLMKLLGINEPDMQYLNNKNNLGNSRKNRRETKGTDKQRYTNYQSQKNKQKQDDYQYNSQKSGRQSDSSRQQQEKEAEERKRKGLERAFVVMGLSSAASADDIRKAYKVLARKYHPDTVQEDFLKLELTEKFKEINWAYNLLRQEFSF